VSAFLDEFLQPVGRDYFISEYWERQPLYVERQNADHYATLFALADADSLLSNSGGSWSAAIRVVQGGVATTARWPAGGNRSAGGLEATYQAYRDGATLIFLSLQERWPSVRALHVELSAALMAPVNMNAYLTPPNASGFPIHYDTHDVFVLQTSGIKRWRLYPPPVLLPLKTQAFKKEMVPGVPDMGPPIMDVDLHPGDLLYVPRGFLHAAEARECASLHLTVGVFPTTLGSVLTSALQSVIHRHPEFRAGLPLGFGQDDGLRASVIDSLARLCRKALECVEWDSIVDDAATAPGLFRRPGLEGHLLDLDALPDLGADTLVRKRENCDWFVRRSGDRLQLSFHGKDISVPIHVEGVLCFIETVGVFAPRDIPGPMDEASKLVLVRRLLLEGALTHA
jgi:JmjC domain